MDSDLSDVAILPGFFSFGYPFRTKASTLRLMADFVKLFYSVEMNGNK